MFAGKQFAKVLAGQFGDAIDVFWLRCGVLGDPGGWLSRWRHQRISEDAGGAGIGEGSNAGFLRFLKEVQRSGDIGINKILF